MQANWTPQKDGVQFLNADLSRQGVRNVSVCQYQSDWTAIALAFPLAGEDPSWEECFPSLEAARKAAEQRFGLSAEPVTVPVHRIEIYGSRV